MTKKAAIEDRVKNEQQTSVAYIYSLIAFATLSVFGMLHFFAEGNPRLGSLEIAGGATFLLAAAGLKTTGNVRLICNLILLIMLTMLAVMLLTGGTADTGIFWVFIFPVSAFFLTNRIGGLWWMAALFMLIIVIMGGMYLGWITTPYSLLTLRQLSVSVAVVAIGIYVYQQSHENMANEARASSNASKEEKIKADIVIENIGEGVVAVDAQGRVVHASKAAAEMLGWRPEELSGKFFAEAIPMIDNSGHKVPLENRPLMRTLGHGEDVAVDAQYLRKDGSSFATQVTSKPIVVDGKIRGAIATFRDTTAEHAIDRTKSEFVTLASHQLRTPISAISWIGELLLHGDAGKLKPEQAEYVQQIYRSNKRMAALVDAMLMTSSLELGNLPIRPERLDLAKLCRTVLEERFDALPADKVLHIEEQYDPELPAVLFDPDIIKTILQNLITNAFKYTPSDGTVTITLKKINSDIVIEISDTGIGIPIKQQPKIFTKLFRADNVKQQDTDGTGLGLYIVKAAAEYAGGRLIFTSQENKGSVFTVYLPAEGMQPQSGGQKLWDHKITPAEPPIKSKQE